MTGANVTLRAVILDPLSYKDSVTVVGTVVLVDVGIERMDISHDGAKLALQLDHLDEASRRVVAELSAADRPQVAVTGAVRKQQRRTYMQAARVSMVHSHDGAIRRSVIVAERIAALPCWEGDAVEVKTAAAVAQELALGEGRTNQNFVVRRGGAGYFVRVGADLPFFGVSRAREQAASRAAAATGLAPAVILTSEDLLVLELVPGRALTEADMLGAARARTPLLATVTRAIRTLHAAPLPPELSAFAQGATGWGGPHLVQWVAYARQQGYCRLPILEGIDELLAQADAAAGAPGPPSFCHFDLLPDNFVLRAGGAEVSLVDFEYAAAGQPLMDLAVLCMGCGLEGAEERNLLASYLEVDQPSEAQAHAFAALKLLACLRETLWGVTAEISGSSALRADEAVSYADLNYAKFVRARAALVLPARGVPPALVFTMPESTA